MTEYEGRIANAEGYASTYCDARHFDHPIAEQDVWKAARQGFIQGDIHGRQERIKDFDKVRECFLDMLNHACGEWKAAPWDSEKKCYVGERKFLGYDSMCLSAYEGALDLAVELEWIKKEDVIR